MPAKVLEVSSYNSESGTFNIPKVEYFYEKKVVVSTCVNAGVLSGLGILPFTHVFIDEAGQAMEPEALVCISGLINAYSVCFLLSLSFSFFFFLSFFLPLFLFSLPSFLVFPSSLSFLLFNNNTSSRH